jgi:hypothetical protein
MWRDELFPTFTQAVRMSQGVDGGWWPRWVESRHSSIQRTHSCRHPSVQRTDWCGQSPYGGRSAVRVELGSSSQSCGLTWRIFLGVQGGRMLMQRR